MQQKMDDAGGDLTALPGSRSCAAVAVVGQAGLSEERRKKLLAEARASRIVFIEGRSIERQTKQATDAAVDAFKSAYPASLRMLSLLHNLSGADPKKFDDDVLAPIVAPTLVNTVDVLENLECASGFVLYHFDRVC